MNATTDTISAVATATGEGGIGIVRLSGPQALSIAAVMFKSKKEKFVEKAPSFTAMYGHVADPAKDGAVIDEAVLLIMRAPASYTGEDVAEFQCHGGSIALREALKLTLRLGARLAEPGEFTKRAFLNGRLDLTQAEAVIDVIRAKTDASLKAAVGSLTGRLSDKIRLIRQNLLAAIAHLEAAIDFPEEDIEEPTAREAAAAVQAAASEINLLLKTAHTGRILREGLKTAIVGKPNVGKSSLLNALLGQNRAIVTDIAGTTRDVIEEYVNIDGIPLRVMDTAGIRPTEDTVEKIGVEMARTAWDEADLSLFLLDSGQELSDEDRQLLGEVKAKGAGNLIVLVNKSDLPPRLDLAEVRQYIGEAPLLHISAKEGAGLDQLKKAVANTVCQGGAFSADAVFASNVRQIELLRQTLAHLDDASAAAGENMPPDCIVVDIRLAWEKLGEINGETAGEDILDQIFSQFCLGK